MDFRRQDRLLDPERAKEAYFEIAGAGSTGSYIAFGLAKLGFLGEHITVYDPQQVEELNLLGQLYRPQDVGKYKTDALKAIIKDMADTNIKAKARPFEYEIKQDPQSHSQVLIAVDTFETRLAIFKTIMAALKKTRGKTQRLIDSRVGGEKIRIIALNLPEHADYFSNSLMGEAWDPGCGAESIAYVSMITGALLTRHSVRILMGEETLRRPLDHYFDVQWLEWGDQNP